MDLWDLLRVLARRWYVTVPLLVLTAVVTLTLGASTSTSYSVKANYLLRPPTTAPAEGEVPTNPYLTVATAAPFGGVLAAVVSSDATRAQVLAAGGVDDYVFAQERNAPLLNLSIEADDAEAASRTLTLVVGQLDQQVVALQDSLDVADAARVGGQLVDIPVVVATSSSSDRLRLAIVAAGLLLTALAALAAEALLSASARRWEQDELSDLDELEVRVLEDGDRVPSPTRSLRR